MASQNNSVAMTLRRNGRATKYANESKQFCYR